MPKMKNRPTLSTIPRSGTWFLRCAVSSFGHPDRDEPVQDHIVGGPLSRARRIDTDVIECPPSRVFRSGDINAFAMEVEASPP
jgi:hypothetical protein